MVSWIWIPLSILFFSLALLGGIGWHILTFALSRRVGRQAALEGLDLTAMRAADDADAPAAWAAAHAAPDWKLESHDRLQLRAWYFPAASASTQWALLVHGYAASARASFTWAQQFHARGYHVLAVDCRAHGRSDGRMIGMGWDDRRDVAAWTRKIAARAPGARILLYGVSMGAAAVMMAAGTRALAPEVRCVIEDCGYTSVYDIFAHRGRQLFHLPPVPVLPVTSLVCRLRCGWSLRTASACKQLRKHRLPTLFIHGEADDFVPFAMAQRLFDAAQGPKELYSVADAGHALSSTVDPRYWDRVLAFAAPYMQDHAPA